MPIFQPDVCLPKDPSGFGQWLTGHYREHLQLATRCLSLSTPFSVPAYDIFSWNDDPEKVQQWLVSHELIHQVLREACGITGTDLSLADFTDEEQFAEWQQDNATEHQQFRQVLGIL